MKQFFLTLLLAGTMIPLFGQAGNNDLRERVYVQTDKQLYLAGEWIQMKIMTVDLKQIPLVFSKVAYAELVDDTIALVQIKVALSNGTGDGMMQLPADIPTGFYRLIAYTQYMRNEGSEVFCEKEVAIVNTFLSGYYPDETGVTIEDNPSAGKSYDTLTVQPDKTTYSTREHGTLIITGLPDHIHSLSVVIAGKDPIPADETSHITSLKSRRVPSTVFSGTFLPEYEGHIITGKIIDNQTGKTVNSNFPIIAGLSFPGKEIRFFMGQPAENGDIRFFTSGISGSKTIATVLYNANDLYRLDIVSPFVTRYNPKPMPKLHIDPACYQQLLERSVALQVTHYYLDDPAEKYNASAPAFKLNPTNSYLLDEYTRFTTMRDVFIEFINMARFRRINGKWQLSAGIKQQGNNINYGDVPLVLLDGAPVSDHELIYRYDPLLVECIRIYNTNCIFGGHLFEGIIEFQTYRGQIQDMDFDRSTQIIPYEGPQSFQKTSPPDYTVNENRRNRTPDSRHTLLWAPDVQTEGKTSLRLPFDTSDLTGDFQVTVEGLTKTGEVIFVTALFIVET